MLFPVHRPHGIWSEIYSIFFDISIRFKVQSLIAKPVKGTKGRGIGWGIYKYKYAQNQDVYAHSVPISHTMLSLVLALPGGAWEQG